MFVLTPEVLLRAYACGLFPMAERRDDPRLFWVDPDTRGIIPLDSFRVSRSLARRIRRGDFEVRVDTAFRDVITHCAEPTAARGETWINDEIMALYMSLHERGYVHSVECWRDDVLVGGLYGLSLRGAFFGESMFSRETDASKVALAHLVERLRAGGYRLLDTQFITPHLASLGAIEISRDRYHELLRDALAVEGRFYSDDGPRPSRQSSTQMS